MSPTVSFPQLYICSLLFLKKKKETIFMHNLTGSELRFPENFLKYLHLYRQTTPNATAGYIYVYYRMDMYVHM